MTTTGSTEAPLRGSTGQIFDLEPPKAAKKSRFPEIALGLLLVVGGALGALIWQISANRTTSVIAVANPISQGEIVELDDLQLVEIRSVDQINVLGANSSAVVVGRVARTDLAPGTLLTGDHVSDGSTIELGDGVVGLALATGEFPSGRLTPGDIVSVILMPEVGDKEIFAEGPASALADIENQILVRRAVVEEVIPLANQGGAFIGLSMAEDEAAVTAQAASLGRVRLVEVPEGS